MIVPALTTLLADASGQVLGDSSPLLRPVLFDQLENFPVFILSPWTLDKVSKTLLLSSSDGFFLQELLISK